MSTVSFRDLTGSAAECYERHFVPAIAAPVSTGFLATAALQPGERVVDVACGTGVIARLAAELVGATGTVTGVDLAPDMIEVARAAAPAIDWHVADATALPVPDASVDVVLCQLGLMFMADRAGAVAEMRRVLATGGRVVVSTPGPMQLPFEVIEQAIADHLDPALGGFVRAVFSMPDPRALGALLTGAGFTDVEATASTAPLALPGPADLLWQYIGSTPMVAIVAEAPDDAKVAMERQVVERLQPLLVDGRVALDQPMVVARGRA